jgi:hypothetical protein
MHPMLGQSKIKCCGSGTFLLDPNFSIPDTRSRFKEMLDTESGSASKNSSILTSKIVSALGNMIRDVHPDPGSGFFPIPDPDFFPIPDPNSGVKKAQRSTGSRIRIRNTGKIKIKCK